MHATTRRPRRRAVAGLLACAALLACGGAGGDVADEQPAALAPPQALWTETAAFDRVVLHWRRADRGGGYELQLAVDGGTFAPLPHTPLPIDAVEYVVTLPSAPELADLAFRIRTIAEAGAQEAPSAWASASFRRTFVPPTVQVTKSWGYGAARGQAAITVEWAHRSPSARDVSLERLELSPVDAPLATVVLPVPDGATAYVDRDLFGLRRYQYRVRSGRDGVWSEPAVSSVVETAAVEPLRLATAVTERATHVSWEPRVSPLVYQQLRGWPGPDIALPNDAVSYLDARWPPWPVQRYALEVCVGSLYCVRTEEATLPPFRVFAAGMTLDTGTLHGRTDDLVRAPDGRWWSGGWNPARQTADGWEEWLRMPPELSSSGLRFDATGTPHRLVNDHVDWDAFAHEWFDGTAWRSERVPALDWFRMGRFDVSPGGDLHVVFMRNYNPWAPLMLHVERVGATWVETELPLPPGYAADHEERQTHVSVGPDGGLAVAFREWRTSRPCVCRRPPGGAWACAEIPIVAQDVLGAVALPASAAIVYTERVDYPASPERTLWQELGDGGPSPAVAIEGFIARSAPVASADGAKVLMLGAAPFGGYSYTPATGVRLAVRSNGAWSTSDLVSPATGAGGALRGGFLADGRWWARATLERWTEAQQNVAATATWTEAR